MQNKKKTKQNNHLKRPQKISNYNIIKSNLGTSVRKLWN